MEVPKELQMAIANDNQQIKAIEVVYDDGEIIKGFIASAKFSPLDVVICKHVVPTGVNPRVFLDTEKAIKISLIYYSGEIRIFE